MSATQYQSWLRIPAVTGLLLLFTPISPALGQERVQVVFARAIGGPDKFYFFLYESCHQTQNWRGEVEGCLQWVLRIRGVDLPEWPVATQYLRPGTHFYALPICPSGVHWRNYAVGRVSLQAIQSVRLTCQ